MLASWNSVEIPGERGRFPLAERYDENLARQLSTQSDGLERQLHLLSWWYERFYTTLDRDHLIRYEDMARSGGRALAGIDQAAITLREQLSSKNLNPLYGRDEMRSLGERLLQSESLRELLTRVT